MTNLRAIIMREINDGSGQLQQVYFILKYPPKTPRMIIFGVIIIAINHNKK